MTKPKKKQDKSILRPLTLLLCVPILLTALLSFAAIAMAAEPIIIFEDPALFYHIEDDMSEVVMNSSEIATPSEGSSAEPTNEPTQQPTQEPTEKPTQEPTQAPTQAPTAEPTGAPTDAPTTAPTASYEIVMEAPTGWYANRAAMEVTVKDIGGTGWSNIKITMGSSTLISGALPSGHVWLDLLDNCMVKVIITDPSGKEHSKDVTVACFDKERPTVKASVKGEYLNIEATDKDSGIDSVQVNGTTYSQPANGKVEIHLRGYADAYEQLLVQAVDKVGNVSKAIAVANPFFHNAPTTAPTNTPKPNNTPKPTKKPSGNGGSSSSGSNSNSGSKATATPTATATPVVSIEPIITTLPTIVPTFTPTTIEPGSPFTSDGNSFTRDLLYDKHTNKQFIAIETRNGDVFYMVIDYDKPLDKDGERYETYFLNLVDSRDLLDIVGETTEVKEPEIIYVTPEPTVMPTQAPVITDTQKRDDSSGMLGVIGLLLALGGGGLWYFKFYKSKQSGKSKRSFEDDYDFDDDEEDEETINEDE